MQLTTNNILEAVDQMPQAVIDHVQDMIDNPDLLIPSGVNTPEEIKKLNAILAYYSNRNASLLGLWGRMKLETERTERKRMAVRDYLEEACKACRHKYEAASRILTSYQLVNQDARMQ